MHRTTQLPLWLLLLGLLLRVLPHLQLLPSREGSTCERYLQYSG